MEVQPYTSKETPMIMYLNIHAGLEQMRVGADTSGKVVDRGSQIIIFVFWCI